MIASQKTDLRHHMRTPAATTPNPTTTINHAGNHATREPPTLETATEGATEGKRAWSAWSACSWGRTGGFSSGGFSLPSRIHPLCVEGAD